MILLTSCGARDTIRSAYLATVFKRPGARLLIKNVCRLRMYAHSGQHQVCLVEKSAALSIYIIALIRYSMGCWLIFLINFIIRERWTLLKWSCVMPKACDGPFLKSWHNWALFLVMLCLVIAILAPTVSFCMPFFIRSPLLQYSGSSIIFKSTPVGFACTLNFAHKDAIWHRFLYGFYHQAVAISYNGHIPQSIHLLRHGESFSNDITLHGY